LLFERERERERKANRNIKVKRQKKSYVHRKTENEEKERRMLKRHKIIEVQRRRYTERVLYRYIKREIEGER